MFRRRGKKCYGAREGTTILLSTPAHAYGSNGRGHGCQTKWNLLRFVLNFSTRQHPKNLSSFARYWRVRRREINDTCRLLKQILGPRYVSPVMWLGVTTSRNRIFLFTSQQFSTQFRASSIGDSCAPLMQDGRLSKAYGRTLQKRILGRRCLLYEVHVVDDAARACTSSNSTRQIALRNRRPDTPISY